MGRRTFERKHSVSPQIWRRCEAESELEALGLRLSAATTTLVAMLGKLSIPRAAQLTRLVELSEADRVPPTPPICLSR
jgi:hypothetical protein